MKIRSRSQGNNNDYVVERHFCNIKDKFHTRAPYIKWSHLQSLMLTLFVCLVGQVDFGEQLSLAGFSFMSNFYVGYHGTKCIWSFNLNVHVKERGSIT